MARSTRSQAQSDTDEDNPQNDVELRRLELEELTLKTQAEQNRRQIELDRFRVKWISGVAAIVLALIGAVGGWMTGWFDFAIRSADTSISRDRAQSDIAVTTAQIEKDYLDSFLNHALNKDLNYRRDFAIYVSTTAITKEVRDNWSNYRTEIEKLIQSETKSKDKKIAELETLQNDLERANSARVAALQAEIGALTRRIQGTSSTEPPQYRVPPKAPIDRESFFRKYRELFKTELSEAAKTGFEALFDYWDRSDELADERWLAYILATVYHETGRRMAPVREGFCRSDECAIKVVKTLVDRGAIARNYAERDPQTGQSYYGRGYIQAVYKRNYERLGSLLGIDLVSEPDLLLKPEVSAAAAIEGMVRGVLTGKKLSDYFNQEKEQWRQARRIVNGLDKAALIERYGRNFLACLQKD